VTDWDDMDTCQPLIEWEGSSAGAANDEVGEDCYSFKLRYSHSEADLYLATNENSTSLVVIAS